jgi:hypothetical protein
VAGGSAGWGGAAEEGGGQVDVGTILVLP